jgi:cation transport ATPase
MNNVDYEWVKQQLTLAKAKVKIGNAILKLLEVWETIPDMDERSTAEIFDMLGKLTQNHALVEEESDGVWVQAMAGQLIVGDRVRVKTSAFTGIDGKIYNGRVGRIVAVRTGRIVFRSTDEKVPLIDGTHFFPEALEKRIR